MRNGITAILHLRSAQPKGGAQGIQSSAVVSTVSAPVSTVTLKDSTGFSVSTILAPVTITYTPTAPVGPGGDSIKSSTSTTSTQSATTKSTSATSTTTAGATSSTQTSASAITTHSSTHSPTASGGTIHRSTSDSHLSKGGVAGIAIGCAALGALIAIGVFFFLMKSQFRKRHHPAASSSRAYSDRSSSRKPGHLNSTVREHVGSRHKGGIVERSPEEVTVENVLEQPKDDSTIKQVVATLFKVIEDHAENYYMDTSSRTGQASNEPKSLNSSLPTGINAQSDVNFQLLLADRQYRSSAIASLITAQVLDAIDFFGTPERSLLPEIVTRFLRSSANQVKDNQRSRLNLSRWRTGTAFLLGSEDSSQQRAQLQLIIDVLTADLDSLVGSYINPETDKDRHQHLVRIYKRAQDLGLLLLSQPADWRFHWSDTSNAQRTGPQNLRGERGKKLFFVVQPQLQRVTDNMARRLDRPVTILEWQVLH